MTTPTITDRHREAARELIPDIGDPRIRYDREIEAAAFILARHFPDKPWVKVSERLPTAEESRAGIWVQNRPAPRFNGDQDPDWVSLVRTPYRMHWTPDLREIAWKLADVPQPAPAPEPPKDL